MSYYETVEDEVVSEGEEESEEEEEVVVVPKRRKQKKWKVSYILKNFIFVHCRENDGFWMKCRIILLFQLANTIAMNLCYYRILINQREPCRLSFFIPKSNVLTSRLTILKLPLVTCKFINKSLSENHVCSRIVL
jgi:hypothetical protein